MADPSSTSELVARPTDDEQYGERVSPSQVDARYVAITKRLKITTFVFSALTFGFIVASTILIKKAPSNNSGWGHSFARSSTKELGKWILASLVISIANLILPIHAVFNLVANGVLAPGIIVALVDFFDALPSSSWCFRYGPYPPEYPNPGPIPPDAECLEKKNQAKIVMIITGVLASTVAALYIIRLLLRGIVILRSKFWTKPSWSIPTGRYTFQISLNVIRRDVDESAPSSHGPVHL